MINAGVSGEIADDTPRIVYCVPGQREEGKPSGRDLATLHRQIPNPKSKIIHPNPLVLPPPRPLVGGCARVYNQGLPDSKLNERTSHHAIRYG